VAEKTESKVREHFQVEGDHHPLYKQWADPPNKAEALFGGMPSMFMFCAALGHSLGMRREMKNPKIPVFRWTALAADDTPLLEAIAVKETGSLEVLDHLDQVMEIAQECATAGVDLLRTELTGSRERNLRALATLTLEHGASAVPSTKTT
jgi:hypothetical protein